MSTTRLKRKLGDLGIDPASSKANESFCLIGTPLPPLEKSRDTGEFVPLWKQDVRDEKGRRRLHGAFTGGFSAGYFNTVGSKEGWAPSTFVSSRSDRAQKRAARPEDFMDEEDIAERRADLNLVDENEQMDLLGGTQAEMSRRAGTEEDEKDPITLALEQSLLPAPKDSVGARILKKMGWRIGQGIGPRVTWRQRAIQDGRDLDAEVDEEAKKHLYAPKNTPLLVPARKDNSHGLGYSPGMGLHDSLGMGKTGKVEGDSRLAAGFGLGALNDADEDDLDIYDGKVVRGGSRTAYDASDVHDDDHITSGTRHAGRKGAPPPPRSSSSGGKFSDGKSPVAGFVVSDKPVAQDEWFPLPDIPKDWKPDPTRVWGGKENVDAEREEPTGGAPRPQPHAQWKTGKTAGERGAILGEISQPSAPRSVFEYMSQKDQERIRSFTSIPNRFVPPSNDRPTSPALPSAPLTIPHTEPQVAQSALLGFRPFTSDPTKQARYNRYLQAAADPGGTTSPPQPTPGQDADSFGREMAEYAKAAALFRPVSGAMAGRFTSAAVLDLGPKIIEGLHQPVAGESADDDADEQDEREERIEEKMEEDPKVHAAKLGMYGPMTRETVVWQPARLLCKRFGVKEPNPEPVDEKVAPSDPGSGWQPESELSKADASVPASGSGDVPASVDGGKKKRRDIANIGLGEDDGQGEDTLTYVRPAMDVFKAIFASDDEESEDEGGQNGDDGKKAEEGEDGAITGVAAIESSSTPVPMPPPAEAGPSTTPASQLNPNGVPSTEKIDLATFKPTFIPRSEREGKSKKSKEKDKEKKSKKKKGGALVSFEVDEGGEESLSFSTPRERRKDRDRPKKKKRRDNEHEADRGDEGDDEGMWVEKPPPAFVKTLAMDEPPPIGIGSLGANDTADNMDVLMGDTERPMRGRKRAVDFM